ncbi:5'-methylthioadenosine/adenosylhomocysteine nucleosidase [Howardella ureilytica]
MLGIIGAMQEEVEQLISVMNITKEEKKAGMEFFAGRLEGVPVTIVRSGIGKVNAAICTQILVDDFNVDAVINTGIAGSLHDKIEIADVVLSEDVLHHDMDATGFGYPKGQIPRMDVLSFKADAGLVALAKKACEAATPDIGIHIGRIVSGDQFVSDSDVKKKIVDDFKGLCTEMEGAAIAQTSYLNGIPFVIIRTISDKADNSASVDYPTFEKKAIANEVKIVKKFCTYYNEL